MSVVRRVGAFFVSVLMVGCVAKTDSIVAENWENFGAINEMLGQSEVSTEKARIYLIREQSMLVGSAVNIFADGDYVTSLQPDAYKVIELCATPINLTLAFTDVNLNYQRVRKQESLIELQKGQTYYFVVVSDKSHQPRLQQLNIQQAQQLIEKGLREQVNTLPRMDGNTSCQLASDSEAVLNKYTLSANALFEFSKYKREHVLVKGREEIKKIVDEIKKNSDRIGHIAIIGYTDPVGNNKSNQRLSLQRAETVRDILVENGINRKDTVIEGRGAQNLIVENCESRFADDNTALNQCNLPNRRVEVVTYAIHTQ